MIIGHKPAAAVAAALTVAVAAPAAAQRAPEVGTFSVDPSVEAITARPPAALEALRLRNDTKTNLAVRVFPALMVQRRDGSIIYSEQPRDLVAARQILSVRPVRFDLPTGAARDLTLRWVNRPRRKPGTYVAVVIRGTPPKQPGVQIQNRYELVEQNFLKVPGRHPYRARVRAIRGEQNGPRRLRFLTTVENTGQIAGRVARGRLRIIDARGRVVHTQRWDREGILLPGYSVDFPTSVTKVLPAGRYRVESELRFGRTARRRAGDGGFRLLGPNRLPTVRFDLLRIAGRAIAGEDGKLRAVVRNTGTVAAAPAVRARLFRIRGGQVDRRPLGSGRGTGDRLDPGAEATIEFGIGRKLARGTYQVVADVVAGGRSFESLVGTFEPTQRESVGRRLRTWVTNHSLTVTLLLAALVAAIAIAAWLYIRRLRSQVRSPAAAMAPPAAPPPVAAPPAAPPPPVTAAPAAPPPLAAPPVAAPAREPHEGRVDLNTAAPEDLMTLPGVGRQAAERIVAHRERHGPFAAVGDLAAVEGFHAERIRRLADRVTI